jgi:hypothetical protein
MVGTTGEPLLSEINHLQKGEGVTAPLKRNEYLVSRPHLLEGHGLRRRRGQRPRIAAAEEKTSPHKITLGEMRASGIRGLPVYCADYQCSHWIRVSADQWPDETRLSELEDKFTCTVCGKHGAEVRPDFDWDKAVSDIDQIAIDNVAKALYPTAVPATVNRQVYTPISAILKRAGVERKIMRPIMQHSLHTGEVQGSIPCAPTMETPCFIGFSSLPE